MKQVFVKPEELEDYLKEPSINNRISRFWREIKEFMPDNLKEELAKYETKLIKQEEGEFEISGAIAYQFEPTKNHYELFEYLNNFAVFVEHDDERIYRWRKNLKTWRKQINSER